MHESGKEIVRTLMADQVVDERRPVGGRELRREENKFSHALAGQAKTEAVHEAKVVQNHELHVSAQGGELDRGHGR
jgi:hypothetical protein